MSIEVGPTLQNLLQAHPYAPADPAAHFDEIFDASGQTREHYQDYLTQFLRLGEKEITRRWDKIRRQLQDRGVASHQFLDQRDKSRLWKLDPIPMIIPEKEFQVIEKGLRQRAHLLDLLVRDIYGPQKLLRERLIPSQLIFANQGFLRGCVGLLPPESRHLHTMAADMARTGDGNWWIIGDRTQAPSGAGYALENRLLISRYFPDIFRECQVQRLTEFFRAYREALLNMAPMQDPSRVVILTSGSSNEIYFEHVYLSRFMGFNLVEGEDLTVRGDHAYLKTLEGMHEINVILRLMDDDYCDPLEFRSDSMLGVPGLSCAVRAGNVSMANALGSGMLEAPALMPFMASLCRQLLGEDLYLPSVATWWCGQPRELKYVLEHFDTMIVRSAFPMASYRVAQGSELSAREKEAWIRRIKHAPHEFIAQELVDLPTVPIWSEGRLQPRHLMLRSHMVADSDGEYQVMPGGLSRVTASETTRDVSMRMGGGSKDTWVISSEPVKTVSMLTLSDQPFPLRRAAQQLPSRIAENFFWLGRYVERASGILSIMRNTIDYLSEDSQHLDRQEMRALQFTLQMFRGPEPVGYTPKVEFKNPVEQLMHQSLADLAFSGSLVSITGNMIRAALSISDRLTDDSLRLFNRIELEINHSQNQSRLPAPELHQILGQINLLLSAFNGMVMDSMTRAYSWRFLDLGRRLERTQFMTRLLQLNLIYCPESDTNLLQSILSISDSAQTYRSRYLNRIRIDAILDLLVVDETNPRSVAFQLNSIAEHIDLLPRNLKDPRRTPEQRNVLEQLAAVRLADVHQLAAVKPDEGRAELSGLLDQIHNQSLILSDMLSLTYFNHIPQADNKPVVTDEHNELEINAE